ncbi:MAG: lysophospholipid acyltransferase family protein [Alphaproteobacteria bacterium]
MIRSVLFLITFYLFTACLFILMLPALFLPRRVEYAFLYFWTKGARALLWVFCGIKIKVKGLENLPKKNGYIVASKHESAMETVLFHSLIPNVFYIFKQELLWVPIANLHAMKTGCIAIDRSAGGSAMRSMLEKTKKHLSEGLNLVIFPEGTRVAPDAPTKCAPGIAFLYANCDVPVVPVALNTGYCWAKNKTLKKAGTVTVSFLPALEPGLEKREFLHQLDTALEAEQNKLPHPQKG